MSGVIFFHPSVISIQRGSAGQEGASVRSRAAITQIIWVVISAALISAELRRQALRPRTHGPRAGGFAAPQPREKIGQNVEFN